MSPEEPPRVPLDTVLRAFQASVERARRSVVRSSDRDALEAGLPVFGINSIEVELPVQLDVGESLDFDGDPARFGAFAIFDGPPQQRGVIRFRVEALPQYADHVEATAIANEDERRYAATRKRRIVRPRERES